MGNKKMKSKAKPAKKQQKKQKAFVDMPMEDDDDFEQADEDFQEKMKENRKAEELDEEIAVLEEKKAKLEEELAEHDVDEYVDLTDLPDKVPDNTPKALTNPQQMKQDAKAVELPKLNEKDERKNLSFWQRIFKKDKVKKPNMVVVQLLKNNGTSEVIYMETKDDMFTIGDCVYHTRKDCAFTLFVGNDRIPLCILPEWSMIPIGTRAFYELTPERRIAEYQNLALKAIRMAETVKAEEPVKKGGGINMRTILIIGGIILGAWLLLKWSGGA